MGQAIRRPKGYRRVRTAHEAGWCWGCRPSGIDEMHRGIAVGPALLGAPPEWGWAVLSGAVPAAVFHPHSKASSSSGRTLPETIDPSCPTNRVAARHSSGFVAKVNSAANTVSDPHCRSLHFERPPVTADRTSGRAAPRLLNAVPDLHHLEPIFSSPHLVVNETCYRWRS